MSFLEHNFLNKVQNSGNFLLVKDDIGKPKPSTRKLPTDGFVFGKKVGEDYEGAGKLVSS